MHQHRAKSTSKVIAAARLGVFAACLGLLGCENNSSSQPFLTQRGVLPPSPPPAQTAGVAGPLDGTWGGPATPVQTGGGRCVQTQQITGFHVSGNNVRYSGFSGTVDPNGAVQMQFGTDTITGQFRGDRFVGNMVLGKFSRNPTCTYALNLARLQQ